MVDTKIEIDRVSIRDGIGEKIATHHLSYTHSYEELSQEESRRIRGVAQLFFPVTETHYGIYKPLSNTLIKVIQDPETKEWIHTWEIIYSCPGSE